MEARPNPINLVLLLKSRATPLSLAKNKMECFNSSSRQEWKQSLLKKKKKKDGRGKITRTSSHILE